MGEIEGVKGAWGYAEGGMGAVSGCIASSARSHGATILTEKVIIQYSGYNHHRAQHFMALLLLTHLHIGYHSRIPQSIILSL